MSSIASSERNHYSLKALKHVPRRLFRPPTPTVGTVRSFRLTPCFQVSLEDVINAKHLPPLGRKEFEDYLLYKEYSIENLYFWLWYDDYSKAYLQWQRSAPDPATPSPSLTLSYSRAKETFFTHARPYELNLTEKTVQDLINPLRPHKGPRQHPHPDAFAAVKYEIDGYLYEALRRFTANFSGNAGRNRGLFAVLMGAIFIACGCLLIVFSVLSARTDAHPGTYVPYVSRTGRLACIPVLWMGFFTLLAGLQGVCIIIFLFGDVRQLHAYELAKPRISPPLNPRPQAVRLSVGGRGCRGEEKLALGGKGAEIDMDMDDDDDGNSIMLKPGTLDGPESVVSLDKLQGGAPAPTPPPHANPGAIAITNVHTRGRVSIDVTQGSEGVVEITLMRTVEDVYGIDAAPLSDAPLTVEGKHYAAAAATTTTATIGANYYYGQRRHTEQHKPVARTDVEPYRFDFDALPLPPGMTLPPWSQTLRSGQPSKGAMGMGTMGTMGIGAQRRGGGPDGGGGALAERGLFAPLTKVISPLVTRTQWIIFIRSALIGLVLACAVGAASMAI